MMSRLKYLIALCGCLLCCFPAVGQGRIEVSVIDNVTARPLGDVSIYDTRGQILGKTDKYGRATIPVRDFPVLLQKKGFPTQYAYKVKDLQPMMLHRMGGEIPTVTIRPDITDSLLALRDLNRLFFNERDTTLYYTFSYALTLPDEDWEETAKGYIAVNFRGIGAPQSSFNPYRYAYFLQFDYTNKHIDQADDRPLPVNKVMPVVLMFGEDLMSGYGYPLWRRLTSSYLEEYQRDWLIDKDKEGNRTFSAYSLNEDNRLMESVAFDRRNRIKQVTLYTPEGIHAVGMVHVFNNFSKDNGVNSYRTVYTYSQGDSNRVLSSLEHLSTFYKPEQTYYQMKFSARLSPPPEEETCKIPVYYLSHNHYHQEQNGYGLWLLLQEHYKLNRDRWVAIQDREQQQMEKERRRLMKTQEKADTTDTTHTSEHKDL